MNIIAAKNFTNDEIIKAVVGSPEKLSVLEGETLPCDSYLLYEDENGETGELVQLLCFKTENGFVATSSPTVQRTFMRALDLSEQLGARMTGIRIISGTSKNGRKFYDVVPVFEE